MTLPPRKRIVFDEPETPAPAVAKPASPVGRKKVLAEPPKPRQASREGRRGVQVWLSEAAFKQLRLLAVQRDATMQDCVLEGIDLLFQAHGRHRIAKG